MNGGTSASNDRPSWDERAPGALDRARARFSLSLSGLAARVTEKWDRRVLGEKWDRYSVTSVPGIAGATRLEALRDTLVSRDAAKPLQFGAALGRLGLKVARPPMWLSVGLLSRGRAGMVEGGRLGDAYARNAGSAMVKEFLTGDPLMKGRYGSWDRSNAGMVRSPATAALSEMVPTDLSGMSLLTLKLEKLVIFQAQTLMDVDRRRNMAAGLSDFGARQAVGDATISERDQREIRGVRDEIQEVSGFLVSALELPVERGADQTLDPVKVIGAARPAIADRAIEQKARGAGSEDLLDRGMRDLDRQIQAASRGGAGERNSARGDLPGAGKTRSQVADEALLAAQEISQRLGGLAHSLNG